MNQEAAMKDTLALAEERGVPMLPGSAVGLFHLKEMCHKDKSGFSEAKMGRWLGFMQGCLVTSGVATLEEMKSINRKWKD